MNVLIITNTKTNIKKTIITTTLTACTKNSVTIIKPTQTNINPQKPNNLSKIHQLSNYNDLHKFAHYPNPLSPHTTTRHNNLQKLDLTKITKHINTLSTTHKHLFIENTNKLLIPITHDN